MKSLDVTLSTCMELLPIPHLHPLIPIQCDSESLEVVKSPPYPAAPQHHSSIRHGPQPTSISFPSTSLISQPPPTQQNAFSQVTNPPFNFPPMAPPPPRPPTPRPRFPPPSHTPIDRANAHITHPPRDPRTQPCKFNYASGCSARVLWQRRLTQTTLGTTLASRDLRLGFLASASRSRNVRA